MGTLAPELPAESGESFASELAGMGSFFIDPTAAARHVHSKRFWVGPVIVTVMVALILGILMLPFALHVIEVGAPPPNVSPEQYQRGIPFAMMITRVMVYLSPVFAVIVLLIQALVFMGSSALMGVRTGFRRIFNLVAGCGLITLLSSIAGIVILKAKGEVTTQAELRPALGLDIFLPAGSNKFLAAFLGYFSVFEIWWIVMMVLIFAAAFKVTKGKALAVVLPVVFLSLIMRMVFAAFQR